MRRTRGFTLIELLLAMAITVVLASALYVTMNIAFKAKRSAENAVAPARTTSIVSDLIVRDLENCVLPTANGVLMGAFTGTQQGGGSGELDTVDFYCLGSDGINDDSPLSDGVRHVQLLVDTTSNPPVLIRRVWRNLLSSQDEVPQDEILCRGVRSFALQYFDGTQWQMDWDSTTVNNTLPTAVQVTLDMENPAKADAPPYRIVRTIPLACGVSQESTQ